MTLPIGLILDVLLALLLVATLTYCLVLSRKLDYLRSGQGELRQIINELGIATENAERAIHGLRVTADETDHRLSDKLARARTVIDELTAIARAGDRLPAARNDQRAARQAPPPLRRAG